MTEIHFNNLIGREFVHGSDDCYGLGRAFYAQNYGIDLPDMARPENWWDKGTEGLDLYMRHFRSLGFDIVHPLPREIRVGDVFLMAIYRDNIRKTAIENSGRVANHCGIYVGGGFILHHFFSRLSERISYTGMWQNFTVATIRHRDVPPPGTQTNTLDYMSMISPHLRRRLEAHVAVPEGIAP
jgi:cell wall-associated NlpC family hydrolase